MSTQTRPCEICGKMIEPERIDTLPATRLCTEHGRQIQKFGGEFITKATVERTSREGGIKINYGGVDTTRERNDEAIAKLRQAYQKQG